MILTNPRQKDLTERLKRVQELLHRESHELQEGRKSVPPVTLTRASTSPIDDDYLHSGPGSSFTDSEYPTPRYGTSIDERELPDDSATLPTISDYHTDDEPEPPPDFFSPAREDNSSDTMRTSLASIDRDMPEGVSRAKTVELRPTITPKKARILCLAQQGERILQYFPPDAIRGTKVLEYSGLAFKTTKLKQMGQQGEFP